MTALCVNEMLLFQPNDLSLAKRQFVPVSDANLFAKIVAVLAKYFPAPDLSREPISCSQDQASKDRNFLVALQGISYFLKCRRGLEAGQQLIYEAEMAAKLFTKGVAVPNLKASLTKDYVAVQGEEYSALYMFIDKNHFSGDGRELDSAAESFGKLTRIATSSIDYRLSPHSSSSDCLFLKDLEGLLDESLANNTLDKDFRDLCVKHHEVLEKNLNRVKGEQLLITSAIKILHSDYHPLNLLMDGGEVACVLDLEDVKTYPVLAALGFGGYKLIRQMLVNPETRAAESRHPALVRRWLEGWQRNYPDARFSPAELGLGARYRVLSLIHTIMNAYLRLGDRRFNYDFVKQLGSLYEIEVIFDQQPAA